MPPAAYDASIWSNYLSAEVSASAALAGLIFVAVSINLRNIVASRPLVARAAKAICTLMGMLAIATFALVPRQTAEILGVELVALGCVIWISVSWMQHVASSKNPYVSLKNRIVLGIFTHVASAQFVIAGFSLCIGRGGGLYWLTGGFLGSLLIAVLDGWVLLIEIQR